MDIAYVAAQLVQQVQRAQYFSGVALVTYVYDYFLTFDREVEFIWESRWSPVKILFLFNRYFVIINIIVQQFMLGTVNGRRSSSECIGLVQAFIFLTAFGTLLSEIILCIRLWVMWGKNKKVVAGVMTIFVAITVYYITDAEMSFNLHKRPDSPLAHPPKGCAVNVQTHHAYVTPIILIVSDLIKVFLALIPTLRIHMYGTILPNSLMNQVFREGVIFYVYLSIYTVIELVLVIQSADNSIAVVPVFLVIRVVLASRMVLHIRQLYKTEEHSAMTMGSTIRSTYM